MMTVRLMRMIPPWVSTVVSGLPHDPIVVPGTLIHMDLYPRTGELTQRKQTIT